VSNVNAAKPARGRGAVPPSTIQAPAPAGGAPKPPTGRAPTTPAGNALVGRIVVAGVGPSRAGFPAKAVTGESVPVTATVFREGHGLVGADIVLTDPAGRVHQTALMHEVGMGLDQWGGRVMPNAPGDWTFRVEGWADPYATWRHDAEIKVPADIDTELMLAEGADLLERAAARAGAKPSSHPAAKPATARGVAAAAKRALAKLQKAAPFDPTVPQNGTPATTVQEAATLLAAAAIVRETSLKATDRLAAATSPAVLAAIGRVPLRDLLTASPEHRLRVSRPRALEGAWYEIFPRSLGCHFSTDIGWVSGTLRTATDRLDRIAGMGFDVLYLTPIHPIGETFRKGRNNALHALPGEPGSPWAIGSKDGGHDQINPELGTFGDFDRLVARAHSLGMEVAMDLALQCSPDHPWVKQHPEWFTHRPDGSIAYAENPPKKYQDIYPLNFDQDPDGLFEEVCRLIRLWASHGVTILRVDNPHTKPVAFWQRLMEHWAHENPDLVFLAEAFTRPPMMQTLATVGFQLSYSYFAWRNTKDEVADYLQELASEQGSFMRPALFPITPDILTDYLVDGGAPAYKARAVLAATGAPTWGIYSGFECVENVQRPGSEEAIDNEKYEYKDRDFEAPVARDIAHLLTQLNQARRDHPALRRLRNIHVHPTTDGATVCYSRRVAAWESPTGEADCVIVVVNLDPHGPRDGQIHLDLGALGVTPAEDWRAPAFRAEELLTGQTFLWNAEPYVRLDPALPAHVIAVRPL
jgi:starch synthase (maltosyl-transferring)